ncbi:MAG: FAD-binding protein, partial [Chloroflexi bacterium]|nr:FAD-binding protein [Chloroflexota bacterium]
DASGWLDIAIASEVLAGRGSPEGALWVDFSMVNLDGFIPSRPNHIPEDYARKPMLPERPVSVKNTAHAINGGVIIDERGASTVPGLYAAGEVAAGPHGADRLGGGMVTNCQVFGARAGRYAAEFAKNAARHDLRQQAAETLGGRLARLGRGQENVENVLRALQTETSRHLMVVRDAEGLAMLLQQTEELQHERLPQTYTGRPMAMRRVLEVENSLLTAQLMAKAALLRQESRGSHFRRDYPRRDDDQFGRNILLRWQHGELLGA